MTKKQKIVENKIRLIIRKEIKSKILKEGLIDNLVNGITNIVDTSRAKELKKQMYKEDPELVKATIKIEKAKEELKNTIAQRMEEDPDYIERMKQYDDLF